MSCSPKVKELNYSVQRSGSISFGGMHRTRDSMGITWRRHLIEGIRREHLQLLKWWGVVVLLRYPHHIGIELEPVIVHARSHITRSMKARA